jgi:hypothetical protein
MPIIQALGRLRQENLESQTSLDYQREKGTDFYIVRNICHYIEDVSV